MHVFISQLTEKDLKLRSPLEYNHMCELIATSGSGYDSTTYGINRSSSLNDLTYYHVCDYGLPPDVMHDILEGYLPYTLKLMLSNFITSEKFFNIDTLNAAISNFDYGFMETSKPHCLTEAALSLSNGCTSFPLSGKKI